MIDHVIGHEVKGEIMPVTMRDVALKVGVSKQTVSAVLNGKPGISPTTTAKVWQIITELGYQPNLVASSLRHGHTRTIGLLVSNVANPWFAEYARGIENVAHDRGYSVLLCNTYDDPARATAYLHILNGNKVAGIIGGVAPDDEKKSSLPTTIIPLEPANVDQRGAYVATAHLLDLGHRHVATIAAPLWTPPGMNRTRGYMAALLDWNVEIDEHLLVEGTLDYASGIRAVERLLTVRERPTAIFAQQDLLAIGTIAALKRAGVRVPEDIAVIGYDGLEISSLYDPPISTIIQPVHELGRRIMAQLADTIEGHVSALELPPLEYTLAVRRSTVPALTQEWISSSIFVGTPWKDWRNQKGPS